MGPTSCGYLCKWGWETADLSQQCFVVPRVSKRLHNTSASPQTPPNRNQPSFLTTIGGRHAIHSDWVWCATFLAATPALNPNIAPICKSVPDLMPQNMQI